MRLVAPAPSIAGVRALALLLSAGTCSGWQNWTATATSVANGNAVPAPRRGHSMVRFGASKVYLFGGVSNPTQKVHTPKTFEIVEVNSELQFRSYEDRAVLNCTGNTESACKAYPNVEVGVYFNDVWTYDVECVREDDFPCADGDGWELIDIGAENGGCSIDGVGVELCTHPSERSHHSSAVFGNDMIVYGGYSRWCTDYCADVWKMDLTTKMWTVLVETAPLGRRWEAAADGDGERMWLFGGYRLRGGYLDDFWVVSAPGAGNDVDHGLRWQQIEKRDAGCVLAPGTLWADRHDTHCFSYWPPSRSGHALAQHEEKVYMFGGYRTEFKFGAQDYPFSEEAHEKYDPSLPYYLNDLWVFTIDAASLTGGGNATGLWRHIKRNESFTDDEWPPARTGHSLLATDSGKMLMLFGGYRSNFFLQDVWLFNVTNERWRKKKNFVHALYVCVVSCHLRRCAVSRRPLPAPPPPAPSPRARSLALASLTLALSCSLPLSYPPSCEVTSDTGNFSAKAVPTRGTVTDGLHGRAAAPLVLHQQRRQAPGWDGCRDRSDGRTDLPNELMWLQPEQRAAHRSVYFAAYGIILMFGGRAYTRPTSLDNTQSGAFVVQNDLWQFKLHKCPSDCNHQGQCIHGHCTCFDGFYGIDCSNHSCPGDFCYYDEVTSIQVCKPCCHATYVALS